MPPKLFPGLFAAVAVSIPSLFIAALLVDKNIRAKPMPDLLDTLGRVALTISPFYLIGTLTYGVIVWWLLRLVGLLNLPALSVAGLIPAAIYVVASRILRGYDSGWPGAFVAFAVPGIFVGVGLWWFTVRAPL